MNEFEHLPVEGVGVGVGWEQRGAGNEEGGGGDGRGDWEGVVQALHAISFTLCLKGADRFLKTCTSFTKPSGL